MSITIVATAGSASANSFATEAEAITYMATRLNASTWTTTTGSTLTEGEKQALVEATRHLSNQTWAGLRVDTTQVLSWPRSYCVNPDDLNGDYFSTTAIPTRIRDACIELAFQYVKAGTTDLAALDSLVGITEKTIDVITTRYDSYARPQGLERYPRVMDYIRPMLANASGGLLFHTVKG